MRLVYNLVVMGKGEWGLMYYFSLNNKEGLLSLLNKLLPVISILGTFLAPSFFLVSIRSPGLCKAVRLHCLILIRSLNTKEAF